ASSAPVLARGRGRAPGPGAGPTVHGRWQLRLQFGCRRTRGRPGGRGCRYPAGIGQRLRPRRQRQYRRRHQAGRPRDPRLSKHWYIFSKILGKLAVGASADQQYAWDACADRAQVWQACNRDCPPHEPGDPITDTPLWRLLACCAGRRAPSGGAPRRPQKSKEEAAPPATGKGAWSEDRPLSTAALVSELQAPRQRHQDWPLSLEDLVGRRVRREPRRPVDFREFALASGPRWPLHGKGVAVEVVGVEVAFDRPHVDELGARLAKGAQGQGLPLKPRAGFLLELAFGGGQGILARLVAALGNGPGPRILFGPEGTTRMHEQNLEPAGVAAKEQDACAALRHKRSRPMERCQPRAARPNAVTAMPTRKGRSRRWPCGLLRRLPLAGNAAAPAQEVLQILPGIA